MIYLRALLGSTEVPSGHHAAGTRPTAGTAVTWRLAKLQCQYRHAVVGDMAGICDSFSRLQSLGAWAQLRRQYGSLLCCMSGGLVLRLHKACVPPIASHGFVVWGLRRLTTGESRMGRAALATLHLRLLPDVARVPTTVHKHIVA